MRVRVLRRLCLFAAILVCGCDRSTPPPTAVLDIEPPAVALNPSITPPPPTSEEVDEWIRTGNIDRADKAARARLLAEPDSPTSIFLMARVLAAQNRFAEAIGLLRTVTDDDPGAKLAALGQAADWYVESGEWDKAEQCYRLLLQQSPDADIALRRLARLLNRRGFRYEAAPLLKELCRRGNIEEEELRSLITLSYAFSDEKETDVYGAIGAVGHARLAFSKDDYEDVETLLALEQKSSPQAYGLYGRALISQQKIDATTRWRENPVEHAEDNADYWVTVGSLAILEGQYGLAAISLARAILIDPTDKVTYLRYGEALNRLGMPTEAAKAIQTADWLRRSAVIGNEFANDDRTVESISNLVELLDQLGRPFESLGWQAVAIGYQADSLTETQVRGRIAALNSRRIKLLNASEVASESKMLCGLELADLRDRYGDNDQPHAPTLPDPIAIPATDRTVDAELAAELADVAESVGVAHQYDATNASAPEQTGVSQELGGGLGVLDYDLDGLPDLYLVQAAATPEMRDGIKPNRLYRNALDHFVETTVPATADDRGFGMGVSAGDVNQDGFPDLVVANLGPNVLLINNGDGTFTSRFLESEQPALWTTSFAIGDISGDAIPDLVEVNYLDDPTAYQTDHGPFKYKPAIDRVYLNDGSGNFPTAIPIDTDPVPGLGVILTDLDNDGSNDIFIANDGRANHWWTRKRTDATKLEASAGVRLPARTDDQSEFSLIESASFAGLAVNFEGIGGAGMGVAAGDFDLNGSIDLHVTNYYDQPNFLMLQTQTGNFIDGTWRMGLYESSIKQLGFGTQAIDIDNDSRLEIAVLNGHIHDQRADGIPYQMTPQLHGLQDEGRFEIRSVRDSTGYWQKPVLGRGLARLDWNRDGNMDLLATHLDAPTALLENRTEQKNTWLQLRLIGIESERDAIGARVTVSTDHSDRVQMITSGDGYCTKNESILGFGLGDATSAVVRIDWPAGTTDQWNVTAVNERLLLIEGRSDYWLD